MKCVVCENDCIAMCPRCKAAVHHAYGQQNANCSGIHDQACRAKVDEPKAAPIVTSIAVPEVAKKGRKVK